MTAMESQSQSIDISQLKKIALGIYDSDEDGNRLASSRQCLSPSVTGTGIAQPSLSAAATRPNLFNASIDPTTTTGRVDVNTLGNFTHLHDNHVRGRCVQPSTGLIQHIQRSGVDHEGGRSNTVERSNDVSLKNRNSETQLPSTVPDSTERTKARKRRPGMELLGSLSQGDTQPVSQWVYEEYTNKIKMKQASSVNENMPGLTATTNEATSHPSGYADSGHVDLLGAFEQQVVAYPEDASDAANPEHDAMSDITHLEADTDITPEWKGYQQPKTPATHGKKRNHRGEVVSPTSTPRLPVNPFADSGVLGYGVMGLSQVFKATQAPTSPLIQGLPSDDMSERPSPELYFNQRLAVAGTSSSPVKLQRTEFQRAVTEPQTNYVSMKESQARRERALGLGRSSSMNGLPVEDDSDEDFGSEGSLLRRRRMQRKIDDQAKTQFAGLTAPLRPSSSGRDRSRGIPGRTTQGFAQVKDNLPPDTFVVSDDTPTANDLTDASEDDTEREVDIGDATPELMEPDEDDKENTNHPGLQVPMTTSRVKIQHVSGHGSSQSPSLSRAGTSLVGERRLGGVMRRKLGSDAMTTGSSGSTEKPDVVERGSQTVAVADSQASQSERKTSERQRSASPKTPFLPSSLCIPQSQMDLPLNYPLPEPSPGGPLVGNGSSPFPQPPSLSSSSTNGISSKRGNNDQQVILDLASDPAVEPTAERSSSSVIEHGRDVQSEPERASAGRGGLARSKKDRSGSNAGLCASPNTTPVAAPDENVSSPIPAHDRARTSESAGAKTKAPRSTIPETSPGGGSEFNLSAKQSLEKVRASSSAPSTTARAPNLERQAPHSNSTSVFETAQTHLTSDTTRAGSSRQESESARPLISPKVIRLRHFTEVASPTLPDAVGEDLMVGSLITSEDIEYQAAVDGSSPVRPSRKRRRGVGGHVVPVAKPDAMRSSPVSLHPSQEREKINDRPRLAVQPAVGVEAPAKRVSRSTSSDPFTISKGLASTSETGLVVTETAAGSTLPAPGGREVTMAATSSPRSKARRPTPLLSPKVVAPTTEPNSHVPAQPAAERRSGVEGRAIEQTLAVTTITNPYQVFAHFNGRNAAYYPATCIGVQGGEERRFKIRFDDGTIDNLGAYGVKRLELQKGDHIKVDLPNMRTKSYIVLGLKDKHDPTLGTKMPSNAGLLADRQYLMTDIHGYSTVQVYQKQRDSLPGMDPLPDTEIISVPLNSVYLTQTMWSRFKDRQYTHPPIFALQRSGLTTPSENPSTPSTTSSRSPRNKPSAPAPEDDLTTQTRSGLFAGMVFAITYGKNEEEKQRVSQHIKFNGGRIVQDGFHELFHIPTLEPATPSKNRDNRNDTALCLKPHAAQLGFACVIADSHSRRKKHVQALALGLPCLAGRWIEDCIAKNKVLNWEPYLLPSGESAFLGGAVRSRMLQPYPAASARLSATIENRPKILAGRSVLLVMRRGKAEESRKAYLFLTYALGARKVSRALDLGAAKKILAESEVSGERWDLVYVDGKKEQAEKVLFGDDGVERGGDDKGEGRRTRVVGNEFVVQSLISGQLLDDE